MSTIVWIRGKAHRVTSADDSVMWVRGAPVIVVEEVAVAGIYVGGVVSGGRLPPGTSVYTGGISTGGQLVGVG